MIVEIPLVNEDGMNYGIMPIVVAVNYTQAHDELIATYGEETVYAERNMSNQFRPQFLLRADRDGNIRRENEYWLAILEEFLRQRIGYNQLREIVKTLT